MTSKPSDRSGAKPQNELLVITVAKDLCNYVMTVTQKSPKQFRFSLVGRMQNLSLAVIESLIRANDIMVSPTSPARNFETRYAHQGDAMTSLKLLVYISEISMTQSCILMKQYEQIAEQATKCRNLLGAWINSDRKRQSPIEA